MPRTVWAITALHVGLMLVFSLLYPSFTGFDETQHVDAVLSIRHGDGWPAPQQRQLSEGIVAVATPVLQAIRTLPFVDDEVPPRDARPSVASLGVERDSVGQVLPNQITQHPPLYYAVGAAVLAVLPGSADWAYDRTVGVLRLVSILLMAPLPLLAWATARTLRASPVVALTAAVLTVSVPNLHRVGATVNNDAAYTLTFATALLLLTRVAMGDLRRRTVVTTGVVVGLAMLTKGFALVLPLTVGLAFLVGGVRRSRHGWWRSGLLCLTVAFVTGGWWWLRNLVLYGTVQPAGWPDTYRDVLGMVPRSPDTPAPIGRFVYWCWYLLTERFWGGLAINYAGPPTFPHWLTNLLVASAALALLAAVVRTGRRGPVVVVAVLVPFLSTVGIVVYGIWTAYLYSLNFPGAQGRYLFGSVTSLAAGCALGLGVLTGRFRRVLPLLALLLAAALQAAAVYRVLGTSWLPPHEGRSRVDRYTDMLAAVVDWSPWPPTVTLAFLVGTALAGLAVLGLVVRLAVTRDDAAAPTPSAPVPGPA